ncbi:uncharacterized protein [Nicotiana tomentosiformis]|uniref:uncharacterized protein n=1 Tax=Nicotiana tomentosiformis TaxID=4098 RepID=UPI00388C6591
MAKISKFVPQEETPSASRLAVEENVSSAATKELTRKPPLQMFIPMGCPTCADFKASVLHHETFLRYRKELNQQEADTRGLTKKRDAYKLLSEKLQTDLDAVRKEHADLVEQVRRVFEVSDDESDTVANGPNPQVQKKLDQIEQLQAEVDTVKAEAEEWKRNMDHLTSEKETFRVQLTLAEVQLRAAKEKALVKAKKVEGLQSHLSSVVSDQGNMAKELEVAKSEVIVVKAEADERVAQHKVVAEAAQDLEKKYGQAYEVAIPKRGPRGSSHSGV